MPSSDWGFAVAFLQERGDPWPEAFASHDLRWHATMERRGGPPFPSRRALAARWAWTEHAVRVLLASESWRDMAHPPPDRAEPLTRRGFAQTSPSGRPVVAQDSPNTATANADNEPKPAQTSPSGRPVVAQDSPHARSSCSPITDHRSPDQDLPPDPKPPDPATVLYGVWRDAHPTARATPSDDNRKAVTRILAECDGIAAAGVYLAWVATSLDEAAQRLRGDAPWPDGKPVRRDDLESLSRHIPSRLPAAMAWEARGRTSGRVATRSEAADAWEQCRVGRFPTDGPGSAALRAIGGSSAFRARSVFDEPRMRERFTEAFDNTNQKAAK